MSTAEKGEAPPPVAQSQSRSSSSDGEVGAVKESWATRNGFNLRSFTKKESGADIELERPMKTRHLHMISIGMPRDPRSWGGNAVDGPPANTLTIQVAPSVLVSLLVPVALWPKVALAACSLISPLSVS